MNWREKLLSTYAEFSAVIVGVESKEVIHTDVTIKSLTYRCMGLRSLSKVPSTTKGVLFVNSYFNSKLYNFFKHTSGYMKL